MDRLERIGQKLNRLPVCVTNANCCMLMYNPLQAAPNDLFGQKETSNDWSEELFSCFLQEKIAPQLPIQSSRQSSEQTLN